MKAPKQINLKMKLIKSNLPQVGERKDKEMKSWIIIGISCLMLIIWVFGKGFIR